MRTGWLPVIAAVSTLGVVAVTNRHALPADSGQLTQSFRAVLSGRLGSVYPPRTAMTSPPGFVLLAAPIVLALGGLSHGVETTLAIMALGLLAFATDRVLIRLRAEVAPRTRAVAVLVVIVGAPAADGLWADYHPEDLVALSLLMLALLEMDRQRWCTTGVLVALAVLTRQWAVAGALVIVVAVWPDARRVAATAMVVGAVLLLPFATLEWPGLLHALEAPGLSPSPYSPWSHIGLSASARYLTGRVGPVVAAAAMAVALGRRWARRRPSLSQVVGAVALVSELRVILDPATFAYYDLPPFAFLVVWAAADVGRRRSRWMAVVLLVPELLWLLQGLPDGIGTSLAVGLRPGRATLIAACQLLAEVTAASVAWRIATDGGVSVGPDGRALKNRLDQTMTRA